MNGKFPATPLGSTGSAATIPVSIFQPEDAKRAEKRARSPVFKRAPDQADLVEPDDVQKTQKNINDAYLQFGKPLDMRFAYKVHGAALAPQWDTVWTDDFSSTSDAFRNMALNGVHVQFANSVAANLKQSLDLLSKEGDAQFNHANVSKILDRVNDIIEIDSPTSRLSNLVLDMEHVAVTRMRNLVDAQIRRRGARSHYFYVVQDLLDLQRFGNNIGHLCRSLRRDDHTYLPFGHLVGKLLCEALYVKGVTAVNYMQLRLMRAEITRALEEAVTALMSMDRAINLDKIGQPEHASLYQYADASLLFSQSENKRRRASHATTPSVVAAEFVSLQPPGTATTPVLPDSDTAGGTVEAGIGAVFS